MNHLPNCKQHTTYGAYSKCKKKYLDGFKKKDFFFDTTLEGLAKHLLDECLDLNIWQSDYKDIKSVYKTIFEDVNSPQNAREFYKYIAKEYLELESSPKEELYVLYRNVSQDLLEISNTIEKLQGKLQKIVEKKKELGFLDVEERYKRIFYSKNWEEMPFIWSPILKDGTTKYKKANIQSKPDVLDEMIEISEKLAKEFYYIRVDLYVLKNKVYFGELTFSHGSGREVFFPNKYDEIYGQKVDLRYGND